MACVLSSVSTELITKRILKHLILTAPGVQLHPSYNHTHVSRISKGINDTPAAKSS